MCFLLLCHSHKNHAIKSRKKFDEYTRKYLHLTQRYNSFQELLNNPPEADIYFCGSDQIWNTQIKMD